MFILPTGFDWADGKTVLPMQPRGSTGAGVVGSLYEDDQRQIESQFGTGTDITTEELPDSPEIERAEQGTVSHRLTMTWENAKLNLQAMGRGTFLQDSFGNIWRILSSKIKRLRGHIAELSYVAESISFDSPPDEFQITPSDLGLDILKHPRYSWALNPIASDQTTSKTVGDTQIFYTDIKTSIIRLIQAYRDAPFFPSENQINGLIQTNIMSAAKSGKIDVHYNNPNYIPNPTTGQPAVASPVRWDGLNADLPTANCPYFIIGVPLDLTDPTDPIAIALAAAKEIISKLWRQEDVPYIPVFQIVWSQYFFRPVYLDAGGYIQDPLGVVPDYFMDPNQDGTDDIFSQLSKINPQAFASNGLNGGPVNISWLRKSDEITYERTWFKVTHTWIGSPIGTWDADLYTQGNRPQKVTDFDQLI